MTSSLHVHSARYQNMREIAVFDLTGRSSPRRKKVWIGGSAQKRFYRSPSFFLFTGTGCDKVSHDFRKQRCIRENVESRHGQSLALSHSAVVSV
jgi:hypothetical protein